MEHRLIWERVHGKIENGYDVHHINGVKRDNRIENLELLNRRDHIRKHKGWTKQNGTWYKPCYICKELLEANKHNYYFTTANNKSFPIGTLLFGHCRKCHIKKVCDDRKAKTA